MSSLKVRNAIAARAEHGWRYKVGNRIVCRSLNGCCLRGLEVTHTSMPGDYRVYAFTQTWFGAVDYPTLSLSFEFLEGRRFGDENEVASQLDPFLRTHEELRRVVFAESDDPVFISKNSWYCLSPPASLELRIEVAVIRSWEGDAEWALPCLQALEQEASERPQNPFWNTRRALVRDVIRCLRDGIPARTVIEPLNAAARAKLRITPIRRPPRLDPTTPRR